MTWGSGVARGAIVSVCDAVSMGPAVSIGVAVAWPGVAGSRPLGAAAPIASYWGSPVCT